MKKMHKQIPLIGLSKRPITLPYATVCINPLLACADAYLKRVGLFSWVFDCRPLQYQQENSGAESVKAQHSTAQRRDSRKVFCWNSFPSEFETNATLCFDSVKVFVELLEKKSCRSITALYLKSNF